MMVDYIERDLQPTMLNPKYELAECGRLSSNNELRFDYIANVVNDKWLSSIRLLSCSVQITESDLSNVFEKRAAEWKADTSHLSSIDKKIEHPSYLRIIGMGPSVVPMIIRDLMEKPDHWFYALSIITGENPVKREDAGKMTRMRDAWVNWAKIRGII